MNYQPSTHVQDPEVFRELQEVGKALAQPGMPTLHIAPEKPFDGMVVLADGVDWDPLSLGVRAPVWFDLVSGSWKGF